MDLRFADHPSFHRAAAGMVSVSAIAGVALHPVTHVAPVVAGMAGIAAGAVLGYGKLPVRALFGAAATVPLLVMAPSAGAVAISVAAMAIGLAYGTRGTRALASVAVGAAALVVAMWTANRFGHAAKLEKWPDGLRDGLAAAAMGLAAVLALLPRHLRISRDPVAAALRGLPTGLDAEVAALCTRSADIWRTTKEQLGEQDPGAALVRDGVLKTLEVAARSTQVRAMGATDAQLAARAGDLDQRIAVATDPEVKTQYEAARRALGDQQRYREQIGKSRERLVARMHNHVAALEKFQLAATGLEAARAQAATKTSALQLEELSQDVAASGDALAELELGAAATA